MIEWVLLIALHWNVPATPIHAFDTQEACIAFASEARSYTVMPGQNKIYEQGGVAFVCAPIPAGKVDFERLLEGGE